MSSLPRDPLPESLFWGEAGIRSTFFHENQVCFEERDVFNEKLEQ